MNQPGDAKPREAWQRFRAHFGTSDRVFLPVVYAIDETQALRNADIAREAQADGVFLVNHGIGCQQLLQIAAKMADAQPGLFVGVSCLDLSTQNVVRCLPPGVRGVWANESPTADGAGKDADAISEARWASGWDGLLFGTLPSRGLRKDHNSLDGLVAAMSHIDVPTVVGYAKTQPADLLEFRALRRAFGDRPFGIAASIGPDVVEALLPYVNCVMTAPRAGQGLEHLDLQETRRLAAKIHAYRDAAGAH